MPEDDRKNLSDAHTAMPSLAGRKAVITGGTTGIGRAIGVLLASQGVEVFICGRSPEHLDDALRRLNDVGKGGGIAVDLAEKDGVDRFFAAAKERLGSHDIAVINAAIPAGGLTEMDAEQVRYAIATDFTAYMMSAHTACAATGGGGGGGGDVILIGSLSAHELGPHSTIYAAIKQGIAGFAEALRKELAPGGIRVSLIEPGLTGSDFQEPEIPPAKQREMIGKEAMLRAEDIAVAVHYVLTQPSRTVIQQLTIVPRAKSE